MYDELREGELRQPVDQPEFRAEQPMNRQPSIMGSGYGMTPASVDYDIQSTCPEVFDELELKKLRLGDVVALKDQLNFWGRGYYEGAMSIGIIVHGWSYKAGHGPGVITFLSAKPGRIATKKDAGANIAYYLGIREKPKV